MAQVEKLGVFISHVHEEKPVALVLQSYLKKAFGESFPVFVASDQTSVGGGRKWFEHIIKSLLKHRVALVLVSQESREREWINFEAGIGEGAGLTVIPISIRGFSLGKLSFPLAGFNGRSIDDLPGIVADVTRETGIVATNVDVAEYAESVRRAEEALRYRSLSLEPFLEGQWLSFELQNVGNMDLELLMVEAYIPKRSLPTNWSDSLFLDLLYYEFVSLDGEEFLWLACFSARGAYEYARPGLVPVITPTMGPRLIKPLRVLLRQDVPNTDAPLRYQVHAIDYPTDLQSISIADVPQGRPSQRRAEPG